MSVISFQQEYEPGGRLTVLIVPCQHHRAAPILKLATFDGRACSIFTDGTFPTPDDFEQVIATEDPEGAAALLAVGLPATRPHAQPNDPAAPTRWRFRLRCPRPSCSTDIQVTSAKLHACLDPVLFHLWRSRTGEATLPTDLDSMLRRFG